MDKKGKKILKKIEILNSKKLENERKISESTEKISEIGVKLNFAQYAENEFKDNRDSVIELEKKLDDLNREEAELEKSFQELTILQNKREEIEFYLNDKVNLLENKKNILKGLMGKMGVDQEIRNLEIEIDHLDKNIVTIREELNVSQFDIGYLKDKTLSIERKKNEIIKNKEFLRKSLDKLIIEDEQRKKLIKTRMALKIN